MNQSEFVKKYLPRPCISFQEYVKKVVDEQGVESEDFKDLVKVHGKNKLREIYAAAKGITLRPKSPEENLGGAEKSAESGKGGEVLTERKSPPTTFTPTLAALLPSLVD